MDIGFSEEHPSISLNIWFGAIFGLTIKSQVKHGLATKKSVNNIRKKIGKITVYILLSCLDVYKGILRLKSNNTNNNSSV